MAAGRWGNVVRLGPHDYAHDHERAGLRDYIARPHSRPPRRWWPALVVLAFLLGFATGVTLSAAPAPPIVSLVVRPQIMLGRGDIRIEARVPRSADNRLISIAWTSDRGSAGSTLRPLEGEDAMVLHTLWLTSQPAANYLFVATVFNQLGKPRGRAEARIVVPDDGGAPLITR